MEDFEVKAARQQAIFETVVTHLVNQGVQSKSEYDECSYRGANGTMCAVGVLISDSEYDTNMEAIPVGELMKDFDTSLNPEDRDLLTSLQSLHDRDSFWEGSEAREYFINYVGHIAAVYNLNPMFATDLKWKDEENEDTGELSE